MHTIQFDFGERHCMCSFECSHAFGERLRESRRKKWVFDWVPQIYRTSDLDRLPDPTATKELLSINDGDAGLSCGSYLYGPTGAGKTRSLILYLRSEAGEADCIYIRGKTLADGIVSRTRPDGAGGFERWFERFKYTDQLGIDEFDKLAWSPRVLSEVFDLIEHRISEQLPLFLVTQCTPDELARRIAKKAEVKADGAAIARRIKEGLKPIWFRRKESL